VGNICEAFCNTKGVAEKHRDSMSEAKSDDDLDTDDNGIILQHQHGQKSQIIIANLATNQANGKLPR
jgi:hypothetical protein